MSENIHVSVPDPLTLFSFSLQTAPEAVGEEGMRERIGLEPMESISPQHASELSCRYSMILGDIESLRFLPPVPPLTSPREHPSQALQKPHSFNIETGIEESSAQSPPESGEAPRKKMYYHGSPEEQVLQALLDNAKQSGNRGRVESSRANLKRYWRMVIDHEYSDINRHGFAQELKKLKRLHKETPLDPFVLYRIHALARRAIECSDQETIAELEKIRNGGSLRHSSPTGNVIADFAERHATGSGGQCYAYVADALDMAEINLTGGSAYMAANQLARHPKVREIKKVSPAMLPSLPKGAIVVWNCGEGHSDGHISISLGNGKEASDLIREQLTGYGTSCRVFAPLDMIEE
jgi:hypothetical protein